MSTRLAFALISAALLGACATAPGPPASDGGIAIVNSSFVAPSGERVLQQSVVVDATPAEAWQAFTTSEGLRSFVAPVAAIDVRIGGIWEASYDPDAKLGDPHRFAR